MPARTDAARDWYRNAAGKFTKKGPIDGNELVQEMGGSGRAVSKIEIGSMYLFRYDPKHKDTLPYYDRFPLIFPINTAKGGFLGINFHYLPPQLRAKLMDGLYGVVTNQNYDETTKIRASYGILNGAAKYKEFKPTVKHYLDSQVRSKFMYVNPAEWDIALFLPTAQFVGATKQKVYADSRRIIRG